MNDMRQDILEKLTSKDDQAACAFAGEIISESRATNEWYGCFDEFTSLLDHPNSYVRNRALYILAALARWDDKNRFEGILPEYLSHITDAKPITARQCVKALAEVGEAKPDLVPRILAALRDADLSGYRDSMRPLIEKDIRETAERLSDGQSKP